MPTVILFSWRTLLMLGCVVMGTARALGQISPNSTEITRSQVLAAPPKYNFADWKEIADLVNGTEYLEVYSSPVASGFPNNDTVPLRIFLPSGSTGPFPMVLIAHYWGATDLKAESALASDLNSRGIAAAILTLPYHMERTPKGAKSGEMAVRPDPNALTQMMYQSEMDARRAFDFFDQRPEIRHDGYGMVGISLGALVAALTFATDDRISDATFALGGADLAHILWNSSRVVAQREILKRNGWDEEKLRTALNSVEPLSYLPRTKSAKTFVISGKFDTVVPAKSTRELIAHLQDPQILQIGTGHYGGIFVEAKILRTVTDFFAATLNGHSYVAPSKFAAPTLRIGGLLADPQGADLGIGVDVFHLDPAGNRFGSVFVTPRGLRFYLGQTLGEGFSIGLVGSPKGVGAGLLWSIVL